MTVTLFISIITAASVITQLLTEAIKTAYSNAGKDYSANVIALVNAIVVGCGGTAITYMLLGITWDANNILCMFLMGIAVWIASMVGYDKIIQLLKQISAIEPVEEDEEE